MINMHDSVIVGKLLWFKGMKTPVIYLRVITVTLLTPVAGYFPKPAPRTVLYPTHMYFFYCMSQCLTLQRVSGQAELADNVAWDVRLHQVSLFGVILGRLQQVVKLLWVELLQRKGGTFHCDTLPDRCFVSVWKLTLNINIICEQTTLVLKKIKKNKVWWCDVAFLGRMFWKARCRHRVCFATHSLLSALHLTHRSCSLKG